MTRPSATERLSLGMLMPPMLQQLLEARGVEFVRQMGADVVRQVIFDVMCGRNLRDATEMLTRRRIALVNAALVAFFLKGAAGQSDFISDLTGAAGERLRETRSRTERWVLQWLLGLTDKAAQNVLRDDPEVLDVYTKQYMQICREIVRECDRNFGTLDGKIRLEGDEWVQINWEFLYHLLSAVGAGTLTIRGSEKSVYGKLFERLVLGSALYILGFRQVTPEAVPEQPERVFWLSSRSARRESDATALIRPGQGVRFDIGFIGRGNPEITLDKLTRFEREMEMGREKWYMASFIIVDRIGKNSRIPQVAEQVKATVIQMSMSYWIRLLAQELKRQTGYHHELVSLPDERMEEYLRGRLAEVPIEQLVTA
ncbi:MAG: CfrBI family restriction endonuclease [Anaerolineae bacterium]